MLLLLLPPYFLVLDNKTYANVAHLLLEKLALPINVHTQTPTVTAIDKLNFIYVCTTPTVLFSRKCLRR